MEGGQYAYAKDTRSDEKYKSDVSTGIHNQRIIMDEYLAEKLYLDGETGWSAVENIDQVFGTRFGKYKPDYMLTTPHASIPIPCEVKTQMKPLGEAIYLKQNQIDKLVTINGVVLYATPEKYFMMTAALWQTMEPAEKFSKPAYKVYTDEIQWKQWRYPLTGLRDY